MWEQFAFQLYNKLTTVTSSTRIKNKKANLFGQN